MDLGESVCAYAPMRNEAASLKDWHASIRKALPGCQIVLLDTGSDDGSVDLAKTLDLDFHISSLAGVSPKEFRFDFARNEALSFCTRPWAFAVDLDERVGSVIEDLDERLAALADSVEVIQTPVECRADDGSVLCTFSGERLFRRRPHVVYREPVHNYVAFRGQRITQDWITTIQNRAVRPQKDREERARQRLETAEYHLLAKALALPKDARSRFYLARTYKDARKWEEAIKWYTEYTNVSTWPAERYQAALELGRCLVEVGRVADAAVVMSIRLADDPLRAEGLVLLGDIAYRQKKYDQAAMWFGDAVRRTVHRSSMFLEPQMYGGLVQDKLSMALHHLGDHLGAIDAAREALKEKSLSDANVQRIHRNIECFEDAAGIRTKKAQPAGYYDDLWKKDTNGGTLEQHRFEVVSSLIQSSGCRRVIDVGCGPGRLIPLLPVDTEWYLGIDISEVALEQARAAAEARNGWGCTCSFATTLAVAEPSYNCVVLSEVLEHLDDPAAMLADIAENLDQGGKTFWVVTVPIQGAMPNDPGHVHDFAIEEVTEMLAPYGSVTHFGSVAFWELFTVEGSEKTRSSSG